MEPLPPFLDPEALAFPFDLPLDLAGAAAASTLVGCNPIWPRRVKASFWLGASMLPFCSWPLESRAM